MLALPKRRRAWWQHECRQRGSPGAPLGSIRMLDMLAFSSRCWSRLLAAALEHKNEVAIQLAHGIRACLGLLYHLFLPLDSV